MTDQTMFKDYKIIDKLDFRNNKRHLTISYWLRLLGLFVFGGVFFTIVYLFKGKISFTALLHIKISGLPAIASILLMILDIILVLYLHELIHASVFYFTHGQKPQIGIRGFVIFAAASKQIITRNQMIVNAMAPFIVISLIGLFLVLIIPVGYVSWVFIPTLVNAAAAGGDFMTLYFVKKHPANSLYNDVGDILYALKPIK